MSEARSQPPTIHLVHHSPQVYRTQSLLLHLCSQYPLDKWRYTDIVQIADQPQCYSHPILTLSSRLSDPDDLLASYLHEQIHWFLVLEGVFTRAKQVAHLLQQSYPQLPIPLPAGCGSPFSNYLHIKVLYLVYSALLELVDRDHATTIFTRPPVYTSIIDLVLHDFDAIDRIMRLHNVIIPPIPREPRCFVDITPTGTQARSRESYQ